VKAGSATLWECISQRKQKS